MLSEALASCVVFHATLLCLYGKQQPSSSLSHCIAFCQIEVICFSMMSWALSNLQLLAAWRHSVLPYLCPSVAERACCDFCVALLYFLFDDDSKCPLTSLIHRGTCRFTGELSAEAIVHYVSIGRQVSGFQSFICLAIGHNLLS